MSPPPESTNPGSATHVHLGTHADLETLAALERAAFDDPWSWEEIETLLASGAVVAPLLGSPGAPALAYALVQLLPGECELLRIGVPPAHRRRGLARRLLEAALARLAEDGRPVCHLEVGAENLPARALYERLGFEIVGRRRRYYRNGEDALRYRLEHPLSGG